MLIRLFDGTIDTLQRGLEHSMRRHQVVSQNIANIETPGYRARDVVFEDLATNLPSAPDPAGLAGPVAPGERRSRLVYSQDGTANETGNDVNLDKQMARLAENTLFHQALTQLLAAQFTALKQAISGRS